MRKFSDVTELIIQEEQVWSDRVEKQQTKYTNTSIIEIEQLEVPSTVQKVENASHFGLG